MDSGIAANTPERSVVLSSPQRGTRYTLRMLEPTIWQLCPHDEARQKLRELMESVYGPSMTKE